MKEFKVNKSTAVVEEGLDPFSCYFTLNSFFFAAIIFGFATQYDFSGYPVSFSTIFSILSVYDLFYLDLLMLFLLAAWCLCTTKILRIVLYCVTLFYIIIYGFQFASFYQGHEYISKLAFENINHISLLLNTKTVSYIVALFVIWGSIVLITEKYGKFNKLQVNKNVRISLILLIAAILCLLSNLWLPQILQEKREHYFQQNYLQRTSPIHSFYSILRPTHDSDIKEFNNLELKTLKKYGFIFYPNEEFPFISKEFYSGSAPFPEQRKLSTPPNIIVFFSEGISSRSIGRYGSKYQDLTPNIDAFAAQSMIVENYYNHTAATYRGLIGQLSSIFPAIGGAGGWKSNYKHMSDDSYLSLANIFNANGYETFFLDAHNKNKAYVDDLMIKLGFTRVFTGIPLARRYLGGEHLNKRDALSDSQFMRSLNGLLEEKLNEKSSNKPIFIGLYNLGTHAFSKLSQDGKPYKDGSNLSLNTIHNFDHAFGIFWEYFKSSPYFSDTIIIFTADHCHYPEKPFVAAFKQDGYQQLFIDQIPLIIYDPIRKLPPSYDAHYATSIDFAPSLLHYLSFPNHKNPFIGNSIFSSRNKNRYDRGVASFGESVYLIDNEQIHKYGYSEKYKGDLEILKKFIKYSQNVELAGQLWGERLNSELQKTANQK